MYVTIDLKNLRFMHTAPSLSMAANLAWIEMHSIPYAVDNPIGRSWLNYMSNHDMKKLYQNTTGQETYYLGNYLKAILAELAERLPELEVDGFEADVQAAQIQEGDPNFYEYEMGSPRATVVKEGSLTPLTAPKSPDEVKLAAARAPRYPSSAPSSTSAPLPHAHTAPATLAAPRGQQRVQRATGAPRTGGIREKIWAVADQLWEEGGKPTDKTSVLNLRKRMMNVLESDHGVKRTSSSNELGNWQKQRIG